MVDETKWIDVNDAIPSETIWCLVYGDGAMACRAWNAERRQWEDWQHCQSPGLFMGDITHWRPLPSPPESGENDEL